MSRRYLRSAEFVAEARQQFSVLTGHGFAETAADFLVRYSSPALDVEVLYDDRDGRVITQVAAGAGDWIPIAGLACLYVAAGVGPAQDIRDIARSPRLLPAVLQTHAEALARLLPVLGSERGRGLLLACHGR